MASVSILAVIIPLKTGEVGAYAFANELVAKCFDVFEAMVGRVLEVLAFIPDNCEIYDAHRFFKVAIVDFVPLSSLDLPPKEFDVGDLLVFFLAESCLMRF